MTSRPKSTKKQVKEMRRLYDLGFSYSEIGRRLHKNHTTVMYWIKGEGHARTPHEQNELYKKLQKEKEERRKIENEKRKKKVKRHKKTNFLFLSKVHNFVISNSDGFSKNGLFFISIVGRCFANKEWIHLLSGTWVIVVGR